MVQLWGLPGNRIITPPTPPPSTPKQINPSCRCVLICNESVFGSSEILLLWCISGRVWAAAAAHPSSWIFFYLKIMILCGAEGPAKGGSLFKMAFAVAVASVGPSGAVCGGRGGRPTHRTDGGGGRHKRRCRLLPYVSNAAHYCPRLKIYEAALRKRSGAAARQPRLFKGASGASESD